MEPGAVTGAVGVAPAAGAVAAAAAGSLLSSTPLFRGVGAPRKPPLFTGAPLELGAASFDKHVGRSHIPVVVDFWAPWCGPCHQMAPAFEHAASQLEPDFRLAKVDTQAVHSLAERFNIRSIPTLALFQGGREVARQTGAMSAPDIVRWVQAQALARNLG